MRIVGCGNLLRGDDGAGILVAERLRALGVEAETSNCTACDLIEAWRGVDEVVVIDAMCTGAMAGTVRVWEESQILELPPAPSTHGFGVTEAVLLARALDLLPPRLRIIGIEGAQFGVGTPLTAQVQHAVEAVVLQLSARA
jgi:hydrogenase maturation protease